MRTIAALVVVVGLPIGSAHAWQQRLSHAYYLFQGVLALGPDGSSFIDIGKKVPGRSRVIAIEKRNRNGGRLWRNGLRDGSRHGDFEELYDLKTTPEGDVIGAGSWIHDSNLVVFRLAGRDGRRQWIHTATGSDRSGREQAANSVAIDGHGDVVAGGVLVERADRQAGGVVFTDTKDTLFVTKIDGRTGGTIWQHRVERPEPKTGGFVHDVLVDDSNDVLVLGSITTAVIRGIGQSSSTVLKLDGATGEERWRTYLPYPMKMSVMARASSGDIFVAGNESIPYLVVDVAVAALDSTGRLRWTHRLATPESRQWEETFSVIALHDGDVAIGGMTADASGVRQFTVARLDAATGDERWRTVIWSTDGFDRGGYVRSLALGPDGTIVAGGVLTTPEQCDDLAVVEITAATGAVERTTTIDGTTTASSCFHDYDCERPPCGDPRAGIDQDDLTSLQTTADGRVVVTGETSDGPHAKHHGLLASWPLR